MSFGDNTGLVKGATLVSIATNGTNDAIANNVGDNQATAFSFSNGNSGDDSIENFGRNDTILNYQKIFDGNNDGIIDFGPNGILDIDRTSKKAPGSDQITLQGFASKQLRYLGEKQGQYVYADQSVKTDAFSHGAAVGHTGIEGTVRDNSFDASTGHNAYLYDTALGLNLGGDTITNFGADDVIITTSAIYNGKFGATSGVEIAFGDNGVLDLSGETANTTGDAGAGAGGQIDLVGYGAKGNGLYLQGTYTANDGDPTTHDVTFYYYGTTVVTSPVDYGAA